MPREVLQPPDGTGTALTRWALRASLLAAGLAVVALASWSTGAWRALAFGEAFVPTAPGTAVMTLLLAASHWRRARTPEGRRESVAVPLLALRAVALAAAFGVAALRGVAFPIDGWIAGAPGTADGIPLGRVSQFTAAFYLLLGLATAWRWWRPRHHAVEAGLSMAVVLGALLVLQSYVLGAPLLYGGRTIPVAAVTAALLLLLGLAGLLLAGPAAWPTRLFVRPQEGPSAVAPMAFWTLATVLSLFVVAAGGFWYLAEQRRNEARAGESLERIAALKGREIAQWHAAQVATARALRALPVLPADFARSGARELDPWLSAIRRDLGMHAVTLLDAGGTPLASAGGDAAADVQVTRRRVAAARSPFDVLVDDVTFEAGRAVMRLWSPLGAGPEGTRAPLGWLLLEIDAASTLFPLTHSVPLPGDSWEVVLWRQVGDSAEVVSAPAGASSADPARRIAIDPSSEHPAVRSLLGVEGRVHGRDFRGRLVEAVVRRVAGTPWLLVVKVDHDEIAAPSRRTAIRATVLSLLLVLAAIAGVYALISRRDLAMASRELQLVREREASIEELERSEARYARAMRGTSDGLWDWDLRTGAVYVSPHWKELVGRPQHEYRDAETAFFDLLHPDDAAAARAATEAHLAHGTPYDLELRVRMPDGTYRRFWTRGEAERDADGRPVRMSGAITDVTARRAAEDALRDTDRLLRVRSAANLALVRATDEHDLLQAVCEVAVREGGYRMAWVGYAEDDAERSVRPVAWSGHEDGYLGLVSISWADTERGRGPTGRAIRTGQVQAAQDLTSELQFTPWREAARARGYAASCSIPLRVGGETIGAMMLYSAEPFAFHEAEVALLTELGNDLSFGIGALRDHRAVAESRSQLALFRAVMDRSNDAVFITDLATGRFIDFNETAARQLGYAPEELRALGPVDVAPELGGEDPWRHEILGTLRGVTDVRRRTHRRKDGSTFTAEVARSLVEVDGRRLVLAIARDISDRVLADEERDALQQQLQRAQRMESVGRLAGGVAHDFNNLLTVINATADLLMAELPPDHPSRLDLQQIRSAGDRAATLTRQLLAFSRQQVMRREVLDLNGVVTGFTTMLRRVIGEDVHLDVHLADGLAPVLADPGQLEQVLMNLCVNARDAMPGGGRLTIETAMAEVDAEFAARHVTMRPGRYVRLSVADTGEGMSPETVAQIFEPFFTTKEPGKGTGLGLATVYGIVKQSGGSIWVTSEKGQGARFDIFLPPTERAHRARTSGPSVAVSPGAGTILLVEDEEAIRLVARRVLERTGYTVLEAANGHEALAEFARHEGAVDLVMTDLVMPGMSGIQLAAELRKVRPGLNILFTSGYSADAVSTQFRGTRDWHFISKPYAVRELAAQVARVMNGDA